MNASQSFSPVPRPARTTAFVIAICAALLGPIIGFFLGRANSEAPSMGHSPLGISASLYGLGIGLLAGLLIGAVLAAWVLGLGYVYGDARRRSMPPILWTIVAALVPNLLGFLLYFVLRQPLAIACSHCGQPTNAAQRYCASCGQPRFNDTPPTRQQPGCPILILSEANGEGWDTTQAGSAASSTH